MTLKHLRTPGYITDDVFRHIRRCIQKLKLTFVNIKTKSNLTAQLYMEHFLKKRNDAMLFLIVGEFVCIFPHF